MRVTLSEARTFAEAATPAEGPGRLLVQLITPGWGSSGYYSEDVLEAAGRDRVFPAGTHMYIDHPSESETFDRPERTEPPRVPWRLWCVPGSLRRPEPRRLGRA